MKGEGSRARNWLLTLNQQEGRDLPDAEEWLNRLFTETKATYVIGQLECGEESGRAHIQAYANWPDAIRFGRLKRFDSTVNLREVKIDNGVRQYCMKEETRVAGPWEFGKILSHVILRLIGLLLNRLLRQVTMIKFLIIY